MANTGAVSGSGPGLSTLTVAEAVGRAREMLEAAGVADARREAEELYASLVRRPTSTAWLERERPAPPAILASLQEAARRRAAGWPQAYATGAANFRGHWLAVDRRVLIPRPETEGLVDLALASVRCAGAGAPCLVADVGTGSGAIAIALALEAPGIRIVATDQSAEALEVARANVEAHGVGDRVALRLGHLLEPLGGERPEVVISNPPYVATREWAELEPGVRAFEPRSALDGGESGLEVIRELVAQAGTALRPGGVLALEVDARRARDTACLVEAAGFQGCTVTEDLFGRTRYLHARRPADGRH